MGLVLFYDTNGVPQPVDVTDGSVHTLLVGTDGVPVGNAIRQDVMADDNNSSIVNLAAGNGYTFTGVASDTLGVAGIQVSLFANKNARVFIEQSPDGTNWDLSDGYVYLSSTNFGVTVQAISSYVRIRVVTNSETTTIFRLQTALCPIVEAVPRSLDQQGNFKVAAPIDDTGFRQMVSPYNEAVVSTRIRTVGAAFDTSLDANYWLSSVSTGTTGVTGSEGIVTSGTANGHYARLYSTRRSRFVSGQSNKCRMNVRLEDNGTANVKRRWGIAWGATMPTITDGAFFQLDGTVFSIVTLKGTTEAPIANGSFNGHLGSTYTPTFTNNNVCEILYTTGSVYFFVGDKLLHKVTASAATWTNTMSFHVWHDVINSGNSAAVSMYLRSSSIYRIGQLLTQPTSYYHAAGTTAGVNLKVGGGNLHGLIINNVVNNCIITLADSTTGATPALFVHTAGITNTTVVSIDFKGIPFSTGLRLIVATQNASVTVIYE